jgi:hypothetical protein
MYLKENDESLLWDMRLVPFVVVSRLTLCRDQPDAPGSLVVTESKN